MRFVGTAFVKNSVFRNNNLLYSGYTKGAGIDMHSGFVVVMGSTFTNNYGTAGQKSTSCLKLSDSAACAMSMGQTPLIARVQCLTCRLSNKCTWQVAPSTSSTIRPRRRA